MPHSFTFQPDDGEVQELIDVIGKVEEQPQFNGRVAVDVQRHGGTWYCEFSAHTSRLLMQFIAELYMELPPQDGQTQEPWASSVEKQEEDGGLQELVHDGPVPDAEEEAAEDGEEEEPYTENHESNFPKPTSPKKLKRPVTVGKTSSPAVTVEED